MTRLHKHYLFTAICSTAALLCLLPLVFVTSVIIYKGLHTVNLDFLFSGSRQGGAAGGILYQIIGSLLMVSFTALMAFSIGLAAAIAQSEFIKGKWRAYSRTLIYCLNAVPSIIFGIFGIIFFLGFMNLPKSWFIGSIILAMMILPTVVVAASQAMNSIPESYRENAKALGLNKWQVIHSVLIPQGLAGATTGLLLGLARAIGETAPIMFIATAFGGVTVPGGFGEVVASLPTHILEIAMSSNDPQALQNAWGAAFVLLSLVILFSSSAFFMRLKWQVKQ